MPMRKIFLLTIALVSALTMMAQERVVTGVVMDGELDGFITAYLQMQ